MYVSDALMGFAIIINDAEIVVRSWSHSIFVQF